MGNSGPLFAVLLAGGMGTRLWPVSRQLHPKQLVRFIGEDSLVQVTIKRVLPLVNPEHIRVVCGAEHAHEIARHMRQVGVSAEEAVIREPCGRNTAPAILLAVLTILRDHPDATLCVLPADHVIRHTAGFHDSVRTAVRLAEKGYIVTFGIQPHYPETGYGYIEGADALEAGARAIRRFVEKPDADTAQRYLAAGTFYWNSGMFTFRGTVMAEEFCRLQPQMFEQMTRMVQSRGGPAVEAYMGLENTSIDYAIMEKTTRGAVLPSEFGWSDIGSWKSLFDFIPSDDHGNVTLGDVICRNTSGCFAMAQSRLIALNHVRGLAVVETPDAVFVSELENSRDVKSIVADLKADGRREYYQHGTVYHHWGSQTQLELTDSWTVDRMDICPGHVRELTADLRTVTRLSLVAGTLTITTGDRSAAIRAGGTDVLPPGGSARLANTGSCDAVLIRVRCRLEPPAVNTSPGTS